RSGRRRDGGGRKRGGCWKRGGGRDGNRRRRLSSRSRRDGCRRFPRHGEGSQGAAAPTEVSYEYSSGRELSPAHCRVSKEPEAFGRIESPAQPLSAPPDSTLTSMVFPLG